MQILLYYLSAEMKHVPHLIETLVVPAPRVLVPLEPIQRHSAPVCKDCSKNSRAPVLFYVTVLLYYCVLHYYRQWTYLLS